MAILLALILGCSLALPASAESAKGPKLETGVIQADGIPAILWFLSQGEQVEVTEELDEKNSLVETEYGTGTMETQLLRFPGEPEYEPWIGYARYNASLYESYELCGKPVKQLQTNTKVRVLDELEDCYVVTLQLEDPESDETTTAETTEPTTEETEEEEKTPVYFAEKDKIGKNPVQYSSGGESSGSSGGGGYSGPQDGGDISMAYYTLNLLSNVVFEDEEEEEKTGPAQVRVDGAKLILLYFQMGDTVQIVAEEGFAPEVEGYVTILIDETYAYVPQNWVLREGEEPFESWDGYAGYNCKLFDNYLLRGKALKQLSANTKLTVLWDDGVVSLVRLNDKDETTGFVASSTLRTTPVPPSTGGDTGSSSSGGGSSGPVWTPPAL